MSNERGELPEGWEWKDLPEVAEIIMGQSPPGSTYNAEAQGLPFYQGKTDFGELHPTPRVWCNQPSKIAKPEDILMSIRAPVGPTNIANQECAIGRGLCIIRPRNGMPSRFLNGYFKSIQNQIAEMGKGSTFTSISRSDLETIKTPVPPLPEQRRLVAKIEQLLAEVRAARAALERVPSLLKQFRQAVLARAFRGELTARDPRDEPAAVLLQRIEDERRTRATSKNYAPPAPPDTSGLPPLPEGWCWASIGQVADCLDYLRVPINKRERINGEIPYYGANGQVGWIDRHLFDEPLVLVVEDESFVGREKPFSYKIAGKSWVNNHAHVLRSTDAIQVDFLNYSLMYYPFTPLTSGTTGRRKLTQQALMSAPLAISPLAEQRRIVAAIENLFAQANAIEQAVAAAQARVNHMEQAVLARAFRGEL